MKKGKLAIISLSAAFLCVILGVYLGRNTVFLMTLAPLSGKVSSSKLYEETLRNGRMDINTATFHQLQTIPGVGEVLAQNIVDYREENGPFLTIDELLYVEGIGETRLEELKNYIYISG